MGLDGSGPDMPFLFNMKFHWKTNNVEETTSFTEHIHYFSI